MNSKEPTWEGTFEICQRYCDAVVNEAMPFLVSRVLEQTTEDQKRVDLLRTTVATLQEQHQYQFHWNKKLEQFFRGQAPTSETRLRDNEATIRGIFGENYMQDLEIQISPNKRQKIGKTFANEVLQVAKLYENLNLSMSMFKKHLFALRDQRVLDGAGKQGVTKWVTMADFKQIRRDLRSLEVTLGMRSNKRSKAKTDNGRS